MARSASAKTRAEWHGQAVSILRGALKTETGFKKVHAAEALIWSGYPQGVEAAFQEELRTQPESIVGVWRTLAQFPDEDGAHRALYLKKIYATLPEAKELALLRTLETLGKLQFTGRSPRIRRFAEAKIGRPAAMARWILASSGSVSDELRLAGLLGVPDAATRGTAAYALRFMPNIRSGTLTRLRDCAELEKTPSPWRTFAWSAFYVHAPQSEVAQAKTRLLSLAEGESNGDKYEIGQALALRGDDPDLPLLEKLMADPEIDVRISASYALIQIDRRRAARRRASKRLTKPLPTKPHRMAKSRELIGTHS